LLGRNKDPKDREHKLQYQSANETQQALGMAVQEKDPITAAASAIH